MRKIKTFTLPVAMLAGILFSGFFAKLMPVTPYLIFAMLLIIFCRIPLSELKFTRMLLWLLLAQVVGSIALYLFFRSFNEAFAQGIMVCVLTPTAVSSVVIGEILGAKPATIVSFNLISNTATALVAPVMFSFTGAHPEIPFFDSFLMILSKVMPLLILPFIAALILRKIAPAVHDAIHKAQSLSFYLWAFALMIVVGGVVKLITEQNKSDYSLEIIISASAFLLCIIQFFAGRLIGKRYGDKIAGGQSLGQKNTVLAIWMSQSYLDPISSIAPATYVIWQNIVNSWQMWRRKKELSVDPDRPSDDIAPDSH